MTDRHTFSMLPQNRREKKRDGDETHTTVRRDLNSSQKQAIITNHFSK
jgi:hypothetical protein